MELLAPAGTMENFIAALEAGADAIFLGGKGFNARASAGNFAPEELREAVRLAHMLGVSVYVTVNILIGDKELPALEKYLQELEASGVDAIIVQDLAVAVLAKRVAPKLHIHGSTQMTAANLATVEFLGRMGFSRVVLARELSLEEIRHICKHTQVEIEVFIHGALCICYSGQCLMSSFLGGRSGNRGACAQPCRLPYELLNSCGEVLNPPHHDYIMSPKDLNYSAHMAELLEAGVASFKVEGRMKKVSYVRQVIGTYRGIIDRAGQVTKNDAKALEVGFNRGFSTAYLDNAVGRTMITGVAPNNQGKKIGRAVLKKGQLYIYGEEPVEKGALLKIIGRTGQVSYITIDEQWKKIEPHIVAGKPQMGAMEGDVFLAAPPKTSGERAGLANFTRKIPVYAYLEGQVDEPTSLTLVTESGESVTVNHDYTLQVAQKTPTSGEKIQAQLGRLGNTIFTLAGVQFPDGSYMWPASVLNELRREGVMALEEHLLAVYKEHHGREIGAEVLQKIPRFTQVKSHSSLPMVAVQIDDLAQAKAAVAGGAQKIIYSTERLHRLPHGRKELEAIATYCKEAGVWFTCATARVSREQEAANAKAWLKEVVAVAPDSISIHFLGALLWLEELGYTGAVEGDTSLHIFNSQALQYISELGFCSTAVSQEATLQQIGVMAKDATIPLEAMVQGQTELMISEYCAIAGFAGTGEKKNCPRPCVKEKFFLRDRKGEEFPLRTDPFCRMHIMNSKDLDLKPYIPELVKHGVHIFRLDGRQRELAYITEQTRAYVELLQQRRPVPPKKTDGAQVTRGHYFRGIF